MRTFLDLATLVAMPLNLNIALVMLFTIVRGLPMTAFLMAFGVRAGLGSQAIF
jgi:hypothetical protein